MNRGTKIVMALILLALFTVQATAEGEWWDNTFYSKNLLAINNTLGPTLTNHQINFNFSYVTGMQPDFDDIRFIYLDSVVCDYWVEDHNESDWCNVWIKAPHLNSASWNNDSYTLYYGNAGATTTSNMTDTFTQAHENTSANLDLPNVVSGAYIFEAKMHQLNSITFNEIGLRNEDVLLDTAYILLNNAYKMRVGSKNDGAGGESGVAGSYATDAIYKMVYNGTTIKYYIDNVLEHTRTTGIPDESMGIFYDRAAGGYCEWVFVREYGADDPITYLGVNESIFLKYDAVSPVINTVLSTGEIICSGGEDTRWIAYATSTDTDLNVTDYDSVNGTGEFEILDNSLKMFGVTGFNTSDMVYLSRAGVFTVAGIIDINGEYRFNRELPPGEYVFEATGYDNETGVEGFIYEGTSTSEIPLSEVVVYIFNTTWSDTTVTDAGGYYAFTGLENTTYSLNFKKDRYEEVLYQYVTPANLSMTYKVIYMQKSTGDYYSRHYVTFTLQNIFGACYSNVDTVVYNNGATAATGTTGTDGAVTFHLFEDIEYTITFIDASQSIGESITLTPRDNAYTVYTALLDFSLDDSATVWASIDYYWTSERINGTHGWINFTFADSSDSTLEVLYWINQTINNGYNAPTYFYNSSVNGSWTPYNLYTVDTVVRADNTTWVCHFSAVNPDLPSLAGSGSVVISFLQSYRIDLGWDEPYMYSTVAIVVIIFIGLLFGQASAATGAVVCCLAGWFFWWCKWLSAAGGVSFVMLCLATVLSVLFVMRKGESLKA